MPPETIEGTNLAEPSLTRRLTLYRELNSEISADSHINNFFTKLIGDKNVLLLDKPEQTLN